MVSDDRGQDVTQLDLTKEGTILFSSLAKILVVHQSRLPKSGALIMFCAIPTQLGQKKAGEFKFSMTIRKEKVKIEETFSKTPLLCTLRTSSCHGENS